MANINRMNEFVIGDGLGLATQAELEQLAVSVTDKKFSGGADPTGLIDSTAAIQAAIDSVSANAYPNNGGVVNLPSGIYAHRGITLKPHVTLRGAGLGVTVLRMIGGANKDGITIPKNMVMGGVSDLSIDGNKAGNTLGNGIVFSDTVVNAAGSGLVVTKTVQTESSYKYVFLERISASYCAQNGIYAHQFNFTVFGDKLNCSYNGLHGLYTACTDNLFSNLYLEKNGSCGLYNTGSNNKFMNIKAIWNGQIDNTMGAINNTASRCVYTSCEAQDNYTHGYYLKGDSCIFTGLIADTNGYLSVGNENKSSRVHAGFNLNNLTNSLVNGMVASYKSVVNTGDGVWVTEYPYTIAGVMDSTSFVIEFPDTQVNQLPPNYDEYLSRTRLHQIHAASVAGSKETYLNIDTFNAQVGGNQTNYIRFFRNSQTTGGVKMQFCQGDGTANVNHEIDGKADVKFNLLAGDMKIGRTTGGGGYNTGHLLLGAYHLWIDSSGRLRVKLNAPSSDTDGTVVGTQT